MAEPLPAEQSLPSAGAVGRPDPAGTTVLGSATYEIIRQRLHEQGTALRAQVNQLDGRRQAVFGSVEFKLLQADRITTAHNCVPRDMVQLDEERFLFGFNVQFGLKKEMELGDVFGVFRRDRASKAFRDEDLAPLNDQQFRMDFRRLYNVYTKASFSKFSLIQSSLFMVFQVGANPGDIAAFKWTLENGRLQYVDGRSESEFRKVGFPPRHDFQWKTPDRESFRYGDHPHISIEDRVFVECVGGDLTIKVEDNTATGEGIYSEPVEDRHQKVDDAEFAYVLIGHLVLLRIKPYKEPKARYFIYNSKQQSAVRVDSIGQSCARLPEDHGLIFPDGYYLTTGELKRFESKEEDMALERVVHAANGEDSLFIFYNRETGVYVLMPYRLIAQAVEERITCHGFCLFPDGHWLTFRADDEPQKHHTLQLRQTPFYQTGYEPPGQRETFLYQVGNKDVVRCLAECNEILTLISRENPYATLYSDLVKRCETILDSYPWLSSPEAAGVADSLRTLQSVADKAVEEFDKVRRLQREAIQRVAEMQHRATDRFQTVRRSSFRVLADYVVNLTGLRQLRGELIGLREVRYVDLAQVQALENEVIQQTDELAKRCAQYLLQPTALDSYRSDAGDRLASVDTVTKVAEGKPIEKDVLRISAELEMLIEIVTSLQIEDATETTRIIDGITAIYATVNQVKAALKKRLQSLAQTEGAAQFSAQMKLLSQSAASYLDLCDSPAKCDEYLNRVTVQLEEMEGAFAGFDEYLAQLTERRTELYEAFEQRKLALVEQRNRRAAALLTAAERILKVIQNRLGGFKTVPEINTYMVSDLMIAKVREIMEQLLALEDSVKADDLQGRLKSAQQDAVRQLKDRLELFVGGEAVIQLGQHRFNINTQPLDLTVVHREGLPHLHLTSTRYFEAIADAEFLASRDVWDQEVVSENAQVYRAEYLAYQLLRSLEAGPGGAHVPAADHEGGGAARRESPPSSLESVTRVLALDEAGRLAWVQGFMGTRYQEGYAKGVHDRDASRILEVLLRAHIGLQLARYHPTARGCALVYWHRFCPSALRTLWEAKLKGFAERNRLFPGDPVQRTYIAALQGLLAAFARETGLYPPPAVPAAGEYLFYEMIGGETFVLSQEGAQLLAAFRQHLVKTGSEQVFRRARESVSGHPGSELELIRDWVRGFLLGQNGAQTRLEEVAAVLFCGEAFQGRAVEAVATQVLENMQGSHPRLPDNCYAFDYLEFQQRLEQFEHELTPRFRKFHQVKQRVIQTERARLRLSEFKPRVLTTFVRSQLIDRVYLPLVGDNLAKQIGAAGDQKRTDLMGLLLLISPPGYGKTTLMEYVASRLGVVFVKINGPALGHNVTSLDPEEAPNAAAREEIERLNLALEMGENVMLCIDDIQHCSAEFLQKFISLCDAQRKIEGVWRGRSRTYDLRGRKVVVVMAGNPYTESGQKFRIPDMLANRADTYNLGDIVGGNAIWFEASYLENAVTSNPVLAPLANKSQKDIQAFIRIAETDQQEAGFEGSYSPQEVEEILSVLRKLVRIRQTVLRVNQEYIHSAAQADEFRTEPPFRLQGSYRNMNRLAEKVAAIMNDPETDALVLDHYRNEAQTLTTGAEANWLKFKELIGAQSTEEKSRWEEIKKTFRRNQLTRGVDGADNVGRVVAQLSAFQTGLEGIQQTLQAHVAKGPAPLVVDVATLGQSLEALRLTVAERLSPTVEKSDTHPNQANALAQGLSEGLDALRHDLTRTLTALHSGAVTEKLESLSHELEMIHSTLATLKDLAAQQRNHLRDAQELLATRARQGTVEIDLTQEMLSNERVFLEKLHQVLDQPRPASPRSDSKETPQT